MHGGIVTVFLVRTYESLLESFICLCFREMKYFVTTVMYEDCTLNKENVQFGERLSPVSSENVVHNSDI